jgi:hypothetical protein
VRLSLKVCLNFVRQSFFKIVLRWLPFVSTLQYQSQKPAFGTAEPVFLNVLGPRNWFQGMNSASLCSLAGRYDNPIPPRFLAPIDFLKIPAQFTDLYRARICKRLWRPGIDAEESIPPAYVAWRAGTTNRVVVPARQAGNRFLGSLKGLQIRALYRT